MMLTEKFYELNIYALRPAEPAPSQFIGVERYNAHWSGVPTMSILVTKDQCFTLTLAETLFAKVIVQKNETLLIEA
jgi:hypothetical protein